MLMMTVHPPLRVLKSCASYRKSECSPCLYTRYRHTFFPQDALSPLTSDLHTAWYVVVVISSTIVGHPRQEYNDGKKKKIKEDEKFVG